MRKHRWTMIALWLVAAGSWTAARAGDLLLNFDRDTLDQAPKDALCKGEVKVVHHAMKPSKNLSVSLAWGPGKAAPEMSLSPADQHLPERGMLMMELMIERKGSPLHILGLTHGGNKVFDFRIGSDGRAIGEGTDGKQSEIVCVNAPPETNHWYGVQLSYDFPARLFNVQMDTYWKTGDLVGGAMGQGDYLERIVFRGEGQAACSYYVDTVRLVAAEKEPNIPGVASMPLGCYDRKIRWETPLLAERSASCAVIVYPSGMAGGAAQGQKIREAILLRSGRDVPCISDDLVVDSETWLVRDEFLSRPMIVLGNATDNKAIYALATKFLTQANRKWPGGDRFTVRSVLEPFAADTNWVVVEASTPQGLEAGVTALNKRIAAAPAETLNIPYFRELGASKGTWAETPFKQEGIDLSKSIPDIKEQIKKKYGPTVRIAGGELFYYDAWTWLTGGSPEAAKYAAGVLLLELERDPWYVPTGHYNYDITIKAWQICFTSGVVDEALINRVEGAMSRSAANPAYLVNDWYAHSIIADGGKLMSHVLDRHWIAEAANFMCGTDYVLSHCRLNPITKGIVEDYHKAYGQTARRLTDYFRPRVDGSEDGDCNIGILNHQVLTGNLCYVRNGTLARAADYHVAKTNNMGAFIGEGAYIGATTLDAGHPGKNAVAAAAWFYRDPQFQYLFNHIQSFGWSSTSKTNLVFEDDLPEQYAQRYVGVCVVPFDKGTYRILSAPGQLPDGSKLSVSRAPTAPCEDLYDCAAFRDGFTPQDAYLLLFGAQTRECMMNNTIPQYADLGQVLLFCNMQIMDRWCRNGASASNGKPCQPAVGCIKQASISSPTVSAISSTDPFNGNTDCTRTILHRAGHYFVVFDRFKALSDDDYTFTCRWRTPHPATLDRGAWSVQAGGGVGMKLISAEPLDQEAAQEPSDGHFSPYMLTQHKAATLKAGQTATFHNMFYASSAARPDQCESRMLDDNCIVIRGSGKDWNETALIGIAHSPANIEGLDIQADIFYFSGDELVAANATKVTVGGKSLYAGPAANFTQKVKDLNLAPVLAKTFESAPAASGQTPKAPKEYGINTLWTFKDLVHAPAVIRVAAIAADKKSWAFPAERAIDPLTQVTLSVDHQCVAWKVDKDPLQMTLDMGSTENVGDVRLLGTIEPMYIRRLAWYDGDLSVTAASCSDDNFQKDIRPIEKPVFKYRQFSFPRGQYSWSGRAPELVVTVNSRARYVRLNITSKTGQVPLQKIVVQSQDPQGELRGELKAADLDAGGTDSLLIKTAHNEIVAVGADGKKRWSHLLPAEITGWNGLDVDSDRKAQTLAYTSDDILYDFGPDGSEKWRFDFYEYSKLGLESTGLTGAGAVAATGKPLPEQTWQRQYCRYLMYNISAWRPDAQGHKEITAWTKTAVYGTSIKQDHKTITAEPSYLGALLNVPDNKVLGKEVMVGAGATMMIKGADGKNILERWMKGTPSGNPGDYPTFLGAAAVSEGKTKGFVGVNPASVEWIPADLGKGWGEFSEVPITAYLLKDIDGDGNVELLLGYQDGFVRVYRLADGAILNKVCAGSKVVGLAALGTNVVVAASGGVRMYDGSLKEQGALNIKAVSAVTLAGPRPLVAVADETGVIHALAP